ncbi:xylulokinase [Collinsella sp. AGMB00827]|uniref:Xylulose kinase n=1 Tax=Collinsella ureilytica TaxID=2869515 RepID=A0ABS7MJX6_9ACTN|nr:xylulokinase [Collinsella urealyticum]MBY4797670.1 xylulokinase [Collinsella urealyticum]
MSLYIGIDVGTSATKVLICDEMGRLQAQASVAYTCEHPHDGWSEQDPDLWYRAAIEAVSTAVSGADLNAAEVCGISFGGQMHGLVLLDEYDRIIRPAILWNDGRSEQESEWLNEVIGRNVLTERCGNISFPGFTASKLLWMRDYEPENFARIAKILLPKDYLSYRMTEAFATDVSDASGTLFFDISNRCWSDAMLEVLGISVKQLPRVYESWERVGSLCPAAAADLGLAETVQVIAGAGDNAAAAIGMGIVRPGDCNISLGTSGTVFLPTSEMMCDANNSLHSFADASGRWHVMGCILSAASANSWWIKSILGSEFHQELACIKSKNLGRNRIFFLPYLMGERSPINDAAARAAFIGMSGESTRADMAQAVLEGVSFALRQCVDAALAMGVEIQRVTLCGGGAKNPIWREMLASILNRPVYLHAHEEGPAFGACILAMVGCGLFPSVEAASEALVPESIEVIEPDCEATRAYQKRYETYCHIYPALAQLFRELPGHSHGKSREGQS